MLSFLPTPHPHLWKRQGGGECKIDDPQVKASILLVIAYTIFLIVILIFFKRNLKKDTQLENQLLGGWVDGGGLRSTAKERFLCWRGTVEEAPPRYESEKVEVGGKQGRRWKTIYLVQFTTGAKHYEKQSY